jgi:hypothetical protein
VKRSKSVKRILLGGLSVGALTACAAMAAQAQRVTPESYFTNEDHIPGVGYYHAPFRGFFAQPYNYYDATRKMYFYGGQWGPAPHRSIVNISAPTPEAARAAESMRTDLQRPYVPRSGFGSTSGSHSIHS